MMRFMIIGFFVLLLIGCSAERTASVSTPFIGTWYQRAAQDSDQPAGFIAVSAQEITFNVDGLPRNVVAITGNETDPGLRSGRLICADGSALFLGLGETLIDQQTDGVRLLASTTHLDLYYFSPGTAPTGQPLITRRLWQSADLATASYVRQLSTSTTLAAAPSIGHRRYNSDDLPLVSKGDQRFLDASEQLSDPYFSAFSDHLVRAKTAGTSPSQLNELYLRCVRSSRSDIMSDLEQARRGDRIALKRVDVYLGNLSDYASVYRDWYSGL